jgi:2-iminobutanoate/2-iminopropanoate deaminase
MSAPTPLKPAVGQPPLGPYSPAMAVGNMVFISGQIPRSPEGGMVNDTIEGATRQALINLRSVLSAAGCSLENVVKTTVFMKDLNDFNGMNAVYAEVFGNHRPARSTVQVARLPADSRVEIECIAVK